MVTTADAASRALIVIDVQNDYDGGNLPIEYPPFAESVSRIAEAMDAARVAGVKVVIVKQLAPADSPIFAAGSHGGELHPVVASRPRDHYVEKKLPSAFVGTDLDAWVDSHGVRTVTIVGYMTHNCDLSTILHAAHRGMNVEFLADASGSLSYENSAGRVTGEEMHRVISVMLQSRFAAVLSTEEWIALLPTGNAAARDGIYASNQRTRRAPAS
jgi:nicotinamidase-related amidase